MPRGKLQLQLLPAWWDGGMGEKDSPGATTELGYAKIGALLQMNTELDGSVEPGGAGAAPV